MIISRATTALRRLGVSPSGNGQAEVREENGSSAGEDSGKQSDRGRKDRPLNGMVKIRWIENEVVVDYGGRRFMVFAVEGMDCRSEVTAVAWSNFLNALSCPIQILVRQRQPDMQGPCDYHRERRPESMRRGRVGQVADSLLELLSSYEEEGLVVNRQRYLICEEGRAIEVSSLMGQCGFRYQRLEGQALWQLYSGCASGMGHGHIQEMYQSIVRPNEIELNHRFARVYEVHRWPRVVNTNFLERLFQMGEEIDVSLWVQPLSPQESRSRLMRQKERFEGSRYQALEKGKMIGPEVELTIRDCGRLLEELEMGLNKLYRITLTVGIYARTDRGLRRAADNLVGHFRAFMAGCRSVRFRQAAGFAALMPALRPGVGEPYLTDTGTMQRLFPFSPPDVNTGEGCFYGIDLRSRAPVLYDRARFGNNGHQVVMARSGAGKSFYVKLGTFRHGVQGVPQYVIDPEGEFGVLAESMGGRVLIPGRPGYGLNPFAVTYNRESGLSDRLTVLVKLVSVMLQGEVDQSRIAIIDSGLSGFYEWEKRRLQAREGGNTVLGAGGMNALHEYLRSGERGERGEELAELLERFVTGSSQYLMAGEGTGMFDNEATITTFNLRHLNDDLKPVATLVCSEAVWGLAVSQPRDRVLVVDECWTVLKTPTGAAALLEIVRRARKYQLHLTCITQDIQDFLGGDSNAGAVMGHAGITLLNNSDTKFVLSQSQTTLPLVGDALALDPGSLQYLKGVARGQGLLVSERGNFPVQVVSTPEERLLINDEGWLTQGEGEQSGDPIADMKAILAGRRGTE